MAQRLNRAMEIMGWRVPEEDNQVFDDAFEAEEQADVREVDFHSYSSAPDVRYEETYEQQSPVASVRRIVTVHPASYADAKLVGEALRDGTPVIVNLTDLPDTEARRIVDFAAGLVFGLRGIIERVTPRVFLLSPQGVEVASKSEGRPNDLF